MNEELTTERLALRELTADDAQALFDYRSHAEIARHQSWKPKSVEDARDFLESLKLHPPYTGGTWRQLAVALRSDGTLIGDCGVHVMKTDSRHAEIGYTIAPDYQRQGYGAEGVRGLLGMLFGTLKMTEITARALASNTPSRALLDKLGFTHEKNGRYVLRVEDWTA